MSRSGANTKPPKRGFPGRRILHAVLLTADIITAVALGVSAFNGYINPTTHGGYWGILGLGFPFTLGATVLLLAVQAFVWKKGALIPLLAMLICSGPILDYCPLHIFNPKATPGAPTFKLMTYNIFSFYEMHPEQTTEDMRNRTMNTILESGADVVCLQETELFSASRAYKVRPEDMTLLSELYPNILRTGTHLVLLSKYPVEEIRLDVKRKEFGADVGAYRVYVEPERPVTIFNLHLQSLGLTPDDKELYKEVTKGKANELSEIKEVKNELLSKVAKANVARAVQAQKICRFIEHFGGPNVIICGDFNDVTGCYTIRSFNRLKFREVYPELGFGPIITYNASRFYFGIDHILYRGSLKPLSIEKGRVPSSDHFPLTATFELTGTTD